MDQHDPLTSIILTILKDYNPYILRPANDTVCIKIGEKYQFTPPRPATYIYPHIDPNKIIIDTLQLEGDAEALSIQIPLSDPELATKLCDWIEQHHPLGAKQ